MEKKGMRIFRKTAKEELVNERQEQNKPVEQPADESYGESESITVFKGQGKRKGAVSDKGKSIHSPKHGQA